MNEHKTARLAVLATTLAMSLLLSACGLEEPRTVAAEIACEVGIGASRGRRGGRDDAGGTARERARSTKSTSHDDERGEEDEPERDPRDVRIGVRSRVGAQRC